MIERVNRLECLSPCSLVLAHQHINTKLSGKRKTDVQCESHTNEGVLYTEIASVRICHRNNAVLNVRI